MYTISLEYLRYITIEMLPRTREDELLAHLNARKTTLDKNINGKIQQTEDKLKMVVQTKEFAEKIQKNWSEVEILNVRKQVHAL